MTQDSNLKVNEKYIFNFCFLTLTIRKIIVTAQHFYAKKFIIVLRAAKASKN